MAEAEFNKEEFDSVKTEMYAEDEFGMALKGYLVVRFLFYVIGIFTILGAVLAAVLGATTINDLVSNATGLEASHPLLGDDTFMNVQICMFVQAAYTILSAACVALLYIKRTKIYAFIDLGLFVIFLLVFIILGSPDFLTTADGGMTAWPLYLLLNPIFSFAALFVGDHFKYMPFK